MNDHSVFSIISLVCTVVAILVGSFGSIMLSRRYNREDSMETERKADIEAIRRRLADLEDFHRRTRWYLEQLGDVRGLPPWKGGD